MSRSNKTPPIVDLHEDIAYYFMSGGAGQPVGSFDEDLEGRQADMPKYMRANVRLVFGALFPQADYYRASGPRAYYPTASSSRLLMLDQVKTYYNIAERHGVRVVERSSTAEELVSGREWRLGIIIHLEGADPLYDVDDLKIIARLGVRSIGLTWNHDNRWAASCTTRRDYGLTSDGEELIRQAQKQGFIIDLAHASDNTVADVAAIAHEPVIVSHGNFRWHVDKSRNLSETMVESIVSTGGLVGVSFISTLIKPGGKATLQDLVWQIIDFVERFGHRHLAIGTDFHGLIGVNPPEGLESVDKLPILLESLKGAGLTEEQVSDIAFGNALRVIRESIPP